MTDAKSTDIHVECPCCHARLTVDPKLQRVIAHEEPPKQPSGVDLEKAAKMLRDQKARREAIFQQSTEDQKIKSRVLDRKFEEALKSSKDQPVTRPTRDFDLD